LRGGEAAPAGWPGALSSPGTFSLRGPSLHPPPCPPTPNCLPARPIRAPGGAPLRRRPVGVPAAHLGADAAAHGRRRGRRRRVLPGGNFPPGPGDGPPPRCGRRAALELVHPPRPVLLTPPHSLTHPPPCSHWTLPDPPAARQGGQARRADGGPSGAAGGQGGGGGWGAGGIGWARGVGRPGALLAGPALAGATCRSCWWLRWGRGMGGRGRSCQGHWAVWGAAGGAAPGRGRPAGAAGGQGRGPGRRDRAGLLPVLNPGWRWLGRVCRQRCLPALRTLVH
jgi:hypothetical protein